MSPAKGPPGGLAQLVERVLSMHEVAGSIPAFSMFSFGSFFFFYFAFASHAMNLFPHA